MEGPRMTSHCDGAGRCSAAARRRHVIVVIALVLVIAGGLRWIRGQTRDLDDELVGQWRLGPLDVTYAKDGTVRQTVYNREGSITFQSSKRAWMEGDDLVIGPAPPPVQAFQPFVGYWWKRIRGVDVISRYEVVSTTPDRLRLRGVGTGDERTYARVNERDPRRARR